MSKKHIHLVSTFSIRLFCKIWKDLSVEPQTHQHTHVSETSHGIKIQTAAGDLGHFWKRLSF